MPTENLPPSCLAYIDYMQGNVENNPYAVNTKEWIEYNQSMQIIIERSVHDANISYY